MKARNLWGAWWLIAVFMLSGCVVRTYKVTKDRIDQDLSAGNRGYLRGAAPEGLESKERKTTRTSQVVEIEMHSPIKFERMSKPKPKPVTETEGRQLSGNRGFITRGNIPEVREPEAVGAVSKYTVQKGETLQKISQKFYGTTKKWTKIYEANKDSLRGPDKIYPGQTINIPAEGLKEPRENLK